MRTETIIKTYAYFSELTDDQKLKVIENYNDINVDSRYWAECDIEDFKTLLELLGYSEIEVFYSGFSSQGDGASFKAIFDVPKNRRELASRADRALVEFPTYIKANMLEDFKFMDFSLAQEDGISRLEVGHDGRYCHSNAMIGDNRELLTFSKQLADILYKVLETTYYYLQSKEAIEDTLTANEYEFDLETLKIA